MDFDLIVDRGTAIRVAFPVPRLGRIVGGAVGTDAFMARETIAHGWTIGKGGDFRQAQSAGGVAMLRGWVGLDTMRVVVVEIRSWGQDEGGRLLHGQH